MSNTAPTQLPVPPTQHNTKGRLWIVLGIVFLPLLVLYLAYRGKAIHIMLPLLWAIAGAVVMYCVLKVDNSDIQPVHIIIGVAYLLLCITTQVLAYWRAGKTMYRG